MAKKNRYEQLIEAIFLAHYRKGAESFEFDREEIETHARKLGIRLPKNLGDLIYTFRYRGSLPKSVSSRAPKGEQWLIQPAGKAKYRFIASALPVQILPNEMLACIKVPDATPGVIQLYALNDEQALLAKVRYNRLVDLFTRVTCYSLQSHLRTTVPGLGQVETDELYVGVDRGGAQYVLPVQAKGMKDRINVVQVHQDIELCRHKYPGLICRPLGAQTLKDGTIALFEFCASAEGIRILLERHYRLVPPNELTPQDIEEYRKTAEADE